MAESYDFKVIKSGKEIEVYDYKDKEVLRGYKRKERKKKEKKVFKGQLDMNEYKKELKRIKEQEAEHKIKSKFSISRTRTNIRRLTNSNPSLDKFLTLTFAESTTDLTKANYLFNQAMKRIIRKRTSFEYIAVVEFQKDVDYHGRRKEKGGSAHYHLLCNLEMPQTKDLKDLFSWERWFALRYWKYGFIKIKKVDQVTNMGAYFCKYLGKDMFDRRMFGKKKFFCSQKLKKPVELTGYKAVLFHEQHISGLKPVFEKTFSSEYAGTINYSAYTLPEDIPVILNIAKQKCSKKNMFWNTKDSTRKISTKR
ncbi:MAG: hypothetical protein PF572_05795 [Patescibacteria group bacterium]|jgi:hypothetical protein|nr:hypothetical protein [Patescibacteria group bacterium]